MVDIKWIKSHLTREQAVDWGFTEEEWKLNNDADYEAGCGAKGHEDDHQAGERWSTFVQETRTLQKHIHKMHIEIDKMKLTTGGRVLARNPCEKKTPEGRGHEKRQVGRGQKKS